MTPVMPVIGGHAITFGGPKVDQPDLIPLPARVSIEGVLTTEWTLTEEERLLISRGENIRLTLCTGGVCPPMRLEITTPEGT